jgi:hypothetical protein
MGAILDELYRGHFGPEPTVEPVVSRPVNLNDQDLLEKMFVSKTGPEIRALWHGDVAGFESHSEADMALMSHLRFWTGNDRARMTQMFQHSGLYRESKEKSSRGYLERTADNVLKSGGEVYGHKHPEPRLALVKPDTLPHNGTLAAATSLRDVAIRDLEWDWRYRIPRKTLTVIDGDPDLGKSVLALDITAHKTTGTPWPDGAPCEKQKVLLLSAEDFLHETIKPRLLAAGGDASMVGVPNKEPVVLPDDLDYLEALATRYGFGMVIIDPLAAYLSVKVNSWNDPSMRAMVLYPLRVMAERAGLTVIAIRHPSKGSDGKKAIHRGGGTIGTIAAARAGFEVFRDPDDPDVRIFAPSKHNLSKEVHSLRFRLVDQAVPGLKEPMPRIAWEGESTHTAESLAAGAKQTKTELAEDFLREYLANGAQPSEAVLAEGKRRQIGRDAIWEAKKALGVKANKLGYQGIWAWFLPPKDTDPDEGYESQ